jgi:hypothetical protein
LPSSIDGWKTKTPCIRIPAWATDHPANTSCLTTRPGSGLTGSTPVNEQHPLYSLLALALFWNRSIVWKCPNEDNSFVQRLSDLVREVTGIKVQRPIGTGCCETKSGPQFEKPLNETTLW